MLYLAWATSDKTGFCQFGQQATSNSVYHFVQSSGLEPADTEINGQAEDGTAYYAIAQVCFLRHPRLRDL